jgi:hypothetical protein
MKMRRAVTSLLGLTLVLALCADGANAGISDAIKNKVKGLKGEPKAKVGAGQASEAGKSRMTPPVTPESLAKFKAAMAIEQAEREKAVKILAAYKSEDDYNKCRFEVMQSPEGMKIAERMSNIGDKATPAEMQKAMVQVSADLETLITAKCGPNRSEYETRRSELMRGALAKGSDAFMKDDNAYFVWKEWVMEFCKYVAGLKQEPGADAKIAKIKDEGLRIPGTGQGIYYLYTATEANELLERCDELAPLIEATS